MRTLTYLINSHACVRSLWAGAIAFTVCLGSAQAEINLGNKGAIAFGLDADVEYNSNVKLDSDEDGDVIGSALPKLLYRYDQGVVRVDAFIGVLFREYNDFSEFDSESFKSGLVVEFPYGERSVNYDLKLDAGFNESTRADGDLQEIVEKETLHANLTGRYHFAERYYLRSGVLYRDAETVTEGFDDVESVAVPLDFFYRYSEDLNFGLGYRFRDTTVDGSEPPADSQDHAIYAAAEGRLSANVDGEIRVGLQRRNFSESSFDDDDGFFAETMLSWAWTTQSTLALMAGSEFITSAGAQSIETMYLDLEWTHRFNEKISSRVAVGYEERDYTSLDGGASRDDELWYVELSGEYILIEDRLILNGSIYQGDRTSSESSSDYAQTLASIGLSLIY